MKTVKEYMAEQKQISTFSDFGFSEETLVNKIPATAIMKITSIVNSQIYTDGFMIQAVAQMENAICAGATQFKVLVSIGFAGECELAKMNPTKKCIFTYEVKEGKVFNAKWEEFLCDHENGFMAFLHQYSESKIFTK